MTLFNAFLEWVRPTDGNYALAQRLRKVVKRVLCSVLEPAGNVEVVAERQGGDNGDDEVSAEFETENLLLGFEGSEMGIEMDDMDWLNTIDWTQGSWMEYT